MAMPMSPIEQIAEAFDSLERRLKALEKSIKKIEKQAFAKGAKCAAGLADEYNSYTDHPYRLGDCILGKLNLRNGKPRRNKRK